MLPEQGILKSIRRGLSAMLFCALSSPGHAGGWDGACTQERQDAIEVIERLQGEGFEILPRSALADFAEMWAQWRYLTGLAIPGVIADRLASVETNADAKLISLRAELGNNGLSQTPPGVIQGIVRNDDIVLHVVAAEHFATCVAYYLNEGSKWLDVDFKRSEINPEVPDNMIDIKMGRLASNSARVQVQNFQTTLIAETLGFSPAFTHVVILEHLEKQ